MRRSINLCRGGIRSYCTDAGDGFQSSKLKIFDRHLKRKQRNRVVWLMKPKDSLLDTVAENLLDRLERGLKTCASAFSGGLSSSISIAVRGVALRTRDNKAKLKQSGITPNILGCHGSVATHMTKNDSDFKKTFPIALCMGGSLEAIRRLLRGCGEKKVSFGTCLKF
ncbi:hypothetical protein FXO38_10786 [Capsicum annuum]|uniref:Uncharacterized protein n=1 Tax=Capsicum annuum TaxID=4072 RepID=A0A2G2YJR3_CAPAN|nr:hypothetical protein FXO37_29745 [Capsicum annuum]KAF3663143.1 hypothetical protein FXO38_10786 [Capsicum annuum]PHT69986.1 hypothetical protein T459_25090 [Capsicum annuum]